MNYKFISKETKEEIPHVWIDEFVYLLSEEDIKRADYFYVEGHSTIHQCLFYDVDITAENHLPYIKEKCKKIIFSNNPSLTDVPQIQFEFDESVENSVNIYCKHLIETQGKPERIRWSSVIRGFEAGYQKRAETYKWTNEDMVEFAVFYKKHQDKSVEYWGKDLFKIWIEQRVKIIEV